MLRIAVALAVLAALALAHADPADARRPSKCYAWGADGKKVKTRCPTEADQAAEAEAYEKMKANKSPSRPPSSARW